MTNFNSLVFSTLRKRDRNIYVPGHVAVLKKKEESKFVDRRRLGEKHVRNRRELIAKKKKERKKRYSEIKGKVRTQIHTHTYSQSQRLATAL